MALYKNWVVNEVGAKHALPLSELLNEIIARGGTTGYQTPFSAKGLLDALLIGPDVFCCFVAAEHSSGEPLGFQTLLKADYLPDGVADIATFVQVGLTQSGVGTSLFQRTRTQALNLGIRSINATIRADNRGGIAFYSRQGFDDFSVIPDVPLQDGTRVDRICKRFWCAESW